MNMHVKADGKFKVGQRVRRTTHDNSGSGVTLKVGTVAEVAAVDAYGWLTIAGYEKLRGNNPDCFEPAPLFAVGDKVRAIIGTALLFVGDEYTVTSVNDKDVFVKVKNGNQTHTLSYPHEYFEPISSASYTACAAAEVDNLADEYGAPKALKIEAGKFYKTRGGRKVGPMEHRHAGFTWRNHGEVRYVDAEGKHIYGLRNCDLIAEWPAVATQQPTTMADIVRKHSGTAVVMLIENGQPKPSTLPFVHLNKDAAATEANRLAGIHKGQEFGVYECVDVRKVERVYEHEWQRLAVGGDKYLAANELMRESGVSRRSANGAILDWLEEAA